MPKNPTEGLRKLYAMWAVGREQERTLVIGQTAQIGEPMIKGTILMKIITIYRKDVNRFVATYHHICSHPFSFHLINKGLPLRWLKRSSIFTTCRQEAPRVIGRHTTARQSDDNIQ